MTPDKPFEDLKSEMRECIDNSDIEMAHVKADDILCYVAKCSHLVTQERYELVELWKKVDKWYA